MKKPSIRNNYTSFTDQKLVPFVQGVLIGMTGNAHYPTPTPRLEDVQTAFDAYLAAIVPFNMRNMVTSALKKEKKAALIALLRQLARYVSATAQDDLEALESSGYHMQDLPQSVGPMPAPSNVRLNPGVNAGELIVRCNREPGARLYEAQVSINGVDWIYFGANDRGTIKVTGLPAEAKVWVRVRLKNSDDFGPWSQVVQGRAA